MDCVNEASASGDAGGLGVESVKADVFCAKTLRFCLRVNMEDFVLSVSSQPDFSKWMGVVDVVVIMSSYFDLKPGFDEHRTCIWMATSTLDAHLTERISLPTMRRKLQLIRER